MCAVVSFVDRDMIMRYFGGGVGHLKNTPPQQAHRSDPVDPDSEEMEVDEEGDPGGNTRENPQDIIMRNRELEVGEDDKEKGKDDNDGETDDDEEEEDDKSDDEDEEDEDEEFACGGDENEDEDYGYGSP